MNMWPIDNKTGMGATAAIIDRPTGDRAARARALLRSRVAARMGKETVTDAEARAFLAAGAQQLRKERAAAAGSSKRNLYVYGGIGIAVLGGIWLMTRKKKAA
jgi:hypothetical protein